MRRTLTLLLTVLVATSAAAPAAATSHTDGADGGHGATVVADPAAPNETATHTATAGVGNDSAGSLTGLAVDYAGTGTDASDVGVADVETVGIDRGGDDDGATVDTTVADDLSEVSASNEGETLTFAFGGSYALNASDEVVVVYGNVTNPAAGSYDVTVDVNPQSSGGESTATLAVEAPADATVTFANQSTDGTTVTVANATLPEGGYVAVHEQTNGSVGAVIGHSSYLAPGSHEDVEVTLDAALSANQTLVAMAHRETNGNETYEFPGADGPYTADGGAVVDAAQVTVTDEPTATETTDTEPTETTDTEPTETTDTETMDTSTESATPAEETGGSGPGFGLVVAVVALAAAALLAVRRD